MTVQDRSESRGKELRGYPVTAIVDDLRYKI